jgi:cystathionine beta-lyase/cystathionine gamma-synthase
MKKRARQDSTVCVHGGEERHGRNTSLTTEIVQTSVFAVKDTAELEKFAAGKSDAFLYTRYANPTVVAAEKKLAALEGGEACVVTASGMAAELCIALAVCQAGDEIVSMLDIYGGTLKQFRDVLSRCGIKTHFVPYGELEYIEKYFNKRTKMVFLETPTNPTLRCVDIERLAAIGRKKGACVVVDNTFATPVLQKPLSLGADLVIHSVTKYLGGHSDVTAGAAVGAKKWIDPIRQMMIYTGGCLDPNAAYLMIRGMKTLQLRVERASSNAFAIAEFLKTDANVERVYYPGLADCEGHAIAAKQMRDFGMMVSFDIKGGGKSARKFIDSLELWYLAASLGGVESTVSYPVLTSHIGLDNKTLGLLGVSPATVRLSVGIEDSADLVGDLDQALRRA